MITSKNTSKSSASQSSHCFQLRVYFEDTDLAGIVYHANYLNYAERARSEWLRDLGVPVSKIKDEFALIPVIKSAQLEYHHPAKMDDLLQVKTRILAKRASAMQLEQCIRRVDDDQLLCVVTVQVVWINSAGRPVRLPEKLRTALDNPL